MIDRVSERRATAVRVTTIGSCAALTAAIPVTFAPGGGAGGLDTAIAAPVRRQVSPGLAEFLVAPSNGPVVLILLFAACAWFAVRGHWWRAATMLVVPEIAVAVNTWVLKPLWERPLHDYLAYPSGHTVHLVAVATTFACLLASVRPRIAIAALTAVALASITAGMIVLGYHHATDVFGGAAAAVALSIGLCRLAVLLRVRAGR
ncbi:phosphatase PAP2 family protein [Nocardia halotolerans]|uniref:Phosphatase PAP2 family protein n=1 Tax=Nocardia halotolerans TaxID=1755878 RepID=A0ABV8VBG9_9NOCA